MRGQFSKLLVGLKNCGRSSFGDSVKHAGQECADGLLQSETVACVSSTSSGVCVQVSVQCMSASTQAMDAHRFATNEMIWIFLEVIELVDALFCFFESVLSSPHVSSCLLLLEP